MEKALFICTPLGKISVIEADSTITRLLLPGTTLPNGIKQQETPLLLQAATQIEEYFQGKRKTFKLPLKLKGTEFQKLVWDALLTIPYGETRSYSEIACQIGRPKASRAVGMANHRNPVAIVVPCHRVIGKNGSLTGYAGGLDKKERLLDLERRNR